MPKHCPNPDLIKRLQAAKVIATETSPVGEPGILIEQDLELSANILSETETGSCNLIIDCSFTGTLSNSFMVRDYRIELPWGQTHVDWLVDPAVANSRFYTLPGGWEYPRQEVLNHRRLELRPGIPVTGKLLGVIYANIPPGQPRGGTIPMKLILTDYVERSFSGEILMMLDRTDRLLARQVPWVPRRPSIPADRGEAVSAQVPPEVLVNRQTRARHRS